MGGMLIESLEGYLKTEIRLYQFLCSVSLGEGKRQCGFAKEAFSE